LKLPRDLSGLDLARALARVGYQVTRLQIDRAELLQRLGF
jgi:hypothetical protein